MRVNILRLLTLTIVLFAYTQVQGKGIISFGKSAHDFGMILEKDGNVSHVFTFTNTGNEPIIISNVSASCGCTTPEWTKSPILPGQKGSVTATYLPAGRPGPFDKSLTVISNSEKGMETIHVKGEVVQSMPSIEEQYPFTVGKNIRLTSSDIAITRISKNETKAVSIAVYNSGTEPIKITFDKIPAHLSLAVEPATVAPKGKAAITCKYDATKKNDWGFTADVVNFKVNGKKSDNAYLTIKAAILDDFSKITSEQRTKASYPQFRITSQTFNNTLKGSLISTSFALTNSGESAMTIRKVSSENGAVTASATKSTVKPGESIEIRISIDTSAFDVGSFAVPIYVFSNSPRNPQASLMVTGTIIN